MGRTWDITGIRTVEDVERTVTIATVHDLEYHAEWMGDEYVTVSVKSPAPVDFHFGDTLTYRDEAFSINYDPNVVKKAARNKHGEGFVYENIKLYSEASKMKSIDFKDVVLEDNEIAYTSLGNFSFYCASVEDLADRLQANLDRNEPDTWKVLTPSLVRTQQRADSVTAEGWGLYYTGTEDTGETDVNIDVDNQKCWDVLKYAYEKFGLSYFTRGTTIVIGGTPVVADHIFRYGINNGLYEVERTADENQEIVTKLFAYGSEQNLPLNYYANLGKMGFLPGTRDTRVSDNVTTYGLSTNVVLYAVQPAVRSGAVLTLRYNNKTVKATLDSHTVQQNTYVWMKFVKDGSGDDLAFYNELSDTTQIVYVISGMDINMWPAALIAEEQAYDYPTALSINRLMLPGFPATSLDQWVKDKRDSYDPESQEYAQWNVIYNKYTFSTDKDDPWIMSSNANAIGIKEGIVTYDGSSQKEIYPTISDTESSYVQSATHITDNGYLPDSSDVTFHLYMYRGDGYLDWENALKTALDTVYVEMTSGYCTGRKFKVNSVKEETVDDTAVWDLTCEREKDSSLERYFPYYESDESGYCQVRQGDTFVVTGIQMPDLYIEKASERLFIAACGYLDRRDHMRYTYLPKVDEIYMQRQDDYIKSGASDKPLIYGTKSYHDTLHAGMKMQFEDTDLGIWHTPYIDQLTIKEFGNEEIPTYEVVLRDEKEKGTLEKLAEKISDLQNPVIAPTERQTRQSRNAEYPEWIQGQAYYYQTLNPEPFEGVVYIETSYVWHKGKKWMCLRTLTAEEPGLGCSDWKVVEGDQTFALKFYKTDGTPYGEYISTRRTNLNIQIVAKVWWGTDDVTSLANAWQWKKMWIQDTSWENSHKTRQITLTINDMPTAWDTLNPAVFECAATFSNIDSDGVEVSAEVGFS